MNWNLLSVVIIYTFLLLIVHILLFKQGDDRAFQTRQHKGTHPRNTPIESFSETVKEDDEDKDEDEADDVPKHFNKESSGAQCTRPSKEREPASQGVDQLSEVSGFDADAARAELESHLDENIKPTNFFQEYSSTEFKDSKLEDQFELPADFDMHSIQSNEFSSTQSEPNSSATPKALKKNPQQAKQHEDVVPSSEKSSSNTKKTNSDSSSSEMLADIEAYNNYDGNYANF